MKQAKSYNSMRNPTQRQLRVGELIRQMLAKVFSRGQLRNEALVGLNLTVSEVRMSPDLKCAYAFISPLGGGSIENHLVDLQQEAVYLRSLLGKQLSLRYTPSLKFLSDTSFDEAEHIEQLLREPHVAQDLQKEVS